MSTVSNLLHTMGSETFSSQYIPMADAISISLFSDR